MMVGGGGGSMGLRLPTIFFGHQKPKEISTYHLLSPPQATKPTKSINPT